jgi:hypothetical protein
MWKGVDRGVPNVCDVSSHCAHLSAKFARSGVAEAPGVGAVPPLLQQRKRLGM